jgi:putative FmdB family regulatory protein
MPLYEYQCESCAHRFERIQKFSDPPVETCPSCSGRVKKLLSSPAIQFKGSGWYITDYAKKSESKETKPASGGKDSSEGSSGSAAGESSSKTDSKDSATPASSPSATSKTSSKTE